MSKRKEKSREKIVSNGFAMRDMLSFRAIYKELKHVYHPGLTHDLTLEKVIVEESRKSVSLTKYTLAAAVLFGLTAAFFARPDFLFMPAAFLLFTLFDMRSAAKRGKRTLACELKLIKLAVRLLPHRNKEAY